MNVTSPVFGKPQLWAVAFRNGAIVPGTSRMPVEISGTGVLTLTPDGSPWTQPDTLSTLRASDTVVVTQRGVSLLRKNS